MKLARQTLLSLRYNQTFSRKVSLWLFGLVLVVLVTFLTFKVQQTNTQIFLDKITALDNSTLAQSSPVTTIKENYLTTLRRISYGLVIVITAFLIAVGGLGYYWSKRSSTIFSPYLTNWRGERQAALVFASQFAVLFVGAVIAATVIVAIFFPMIMTSITHELTRNFTNESLGQMQTALNQLMPSKVVFFNSAGLAANPSINLSPLWLISGEVFSFWGLLLLAVIVVIFVTTYVTINHQNH